VDGDHLVKRQLAKLGHRPKGRVAAALGKNDLAAPGAHRLGRRQRLFKTIRAEGLRVVGWLLWHGATVA